MMSHTTKPDSSQRTAETAVDLLSASGEDRVDVTRWAYSA